MNPGGKDKSNEEKDEKTGKKEEEKVSTPGIIHIKDSKRDGGKEKEVDLKERNRNEDTVDPKEETSNEPKKQKKHVIVDADNISTITIPYVKKAIREREIKGHVNIDDNTYSRRHSVESSIESSTLMSHALREIASDRIIAGPRGVLLTIISPTTSFDGRRLSLASQQTIERMYLRRRASDGYDIPVDFDDAIAEVGHGRFQCLLLFLCGFIYACCSLSTTTLSFVLPAATYDLKMTSRDKGVLNTAPLWGMVLGAYIWGNLADAKGRRFVLIYSLLLDAFAAFLSSVCQSYLSFFIMRIFNGFAIIGSTSMVFAYLGEFLNSSIRDRYLSRLEFFWTFGIIALPVIGFIILPRHWNIGDPNGFHYNSWRMFVFACGLPSMMAAILISRMPESPRFLLLQGRHDHTRQVLVRMYVINTKLEPEHFPVKILNMDEMDQEYYFAKTPGMGCCARFKALFKGLYRQHRDLLRGKSIINIIITCFIDFGLMSVYYTIMLWVPELLHRQKEFLDEFPEEPVPLCKAQSINITEDPNNKVDITIFIHTFIICLACLPTNLMLLFLIMYVSKQALLVGILIGAAIPTAAVYYMKSPFEVTTMLCLFEALTTLVEAILFCYIVEIFPLNTRGTALSLTVTVGRLGAVLGNIYFGMMIDTHCDSLFFTMAGMLTVSGLACFLLPHGQTGQ